MMVGDQRAARVAFAIALVVVAVGTPLSWWQGHEPYPALVMPGFPLYKGAVVRTEPQATVHFADGQTAPVSLAELLPPTPLEATSLVTTAFKNDEWTHDPDALAWLNSQLRQHFPGREPTAMDITWQRVTYDSLAPKHDPIQSVHVDLA
jgi:hypothetical protein